MDVLLVGCRDNDARRFARVKKHYYSRRYEKTTLFYYELVRRGILPTLP